MGSCTLGHAFEATSLLTSRAAFDGGPARPKLSVIPVAAHFHVISSVLLCAVTMSKPSPYLLCSITVIPEQLQLKGGCHVREVTTWQKRK